jgi:integrase/recombinase XerD
MNHPRRRMTSMPERYDQALEFCHDKRLPPEAPRPQPTACWPAENTALLELYAAWLSGGGASQQVIRTIYIPMAGHVLGLALKPHSQLDLETDLQPALEFIKAKGAGPDWSKVCRNALDKFRRFLLHQRGQLECKRRPYRSQPHTLGLPAWLVEELTRYQHLMQRNWRDARLEDNIARFWSGHLRVWRFLCDQCAVQQLADVRRKQLYDYTAHRMELGSSVSTINADLRNFRSFLVFLQEQEYSVPQALLRIHGLKQPDRLPKFLTDEQVRLLRDDFESRLALAPDARLRRDALLDRAAFYLLWQCGLRRGEVEELGLEDLDLPGRRLSVRNGKGMKDRTVYLTLTTLHALEAYLVVRGPGPTDHVFLYRNQPLSKDLIHGRLKAAGARAGVKVYAHRLRHTTATQLLNAGCPVTSIQKFLGHKKLNTTMIYARAHDQTVEQDYYAAIQRVELRLALPEGEKWSGTIDKDERRQLLAMAEQLAQPDLSLENRLELANYMRQVLNSELFPPQNPLYIDCERKQWEHPPPSPALLGVKPV